MTKTAQTTTSDLNEWLDCYLDWFFSTDRDAGWHGKCTLAMMVEHLGQIPESSGFVPHDKMIKEIRYLRAPNHKAAAVIRALAKLSALQRYGVVAHHRAHGRLIVDEEGNERRWTNGALAELAGVPVKTLVNAVHRGRKALALELFGQADEVAA